MVAWYRSQRLALQLAADRNEVQYNGYICSVIATFKFRFSFLYRLLAAPFGVTPGTAMVQIRDDYFEVRFGPWWLRTPVANLVRWEHTGPYSVPKTAGPAHLSLADKGITFATNRKAGICFEFSEPVPAMDPLSLFRHPNVTVTVEDPDRLERAVAQRLTGTDLEILSDGSAAESSWAVLRRWLAWPPGMVLATLRHLKLITKVHRSTAARDVFTADSKHSEVGPSSQTKEEGVGDVFDRVYRVRIAGSRISPEDLMAIIVRNFNMMAPTEVTEFQKMEPARTQTQREFVVRMPGPWNGPVRVVESSPKRIRLQTLQGHMEAGQIEFRVETVESNQTNGSLWDLYFEIHSHARSGDQAFAFLHEKLRIGREMQLHTWAHFCERVADVSEGNRFGKIEVKTIRSKV